MSNRVWQFMVLFLGAHFATGALAQVTCTGEDLSSVAPRPNIDFDTSIQPIIEANCSACHYTRMLGNLDMEPGKAVVDLVNVPTSLTTVNIPRVTPFDLDKSFLFKKINCTDLDLMYGFRMPEAFEPQLPPPPPLSKEDQAAIRDWIVQGALAQAAPPPPSITLGGYLSGAWYDPQQSGHGFLLEFTTTPDSTVPTQNELVAFWFVYTPDGSNQNWVFAQGPYDATKNTVTIPATLFHGPKFPFPLSNYDPNAVQGQLGDWGTLTFTFSDCNAGTASWNSTVPGYGHGSLPLQRITMIQGTACPK